MDYLDQVDLTRHTDWEQFEIVRKKRGRLILLTTKAEITHLDFRFAPTDTLLLGRESLGVPQEVHESADARVVIPMNPNMRSLNIAVAGALIIGEALRQTNQFPKIQL